MKKKHSTLMNCIRNRLFFLVCTSLTWEAVYRLKVFPPLIFPSVLEISNSLIVGIAKKSLLIKALMSLCLLIEGIIVGLLVALFLAGLSRMNDVFKNVILNLITYLNPLPGLAVLPLSLVWFGIGRRSVLFVVLHSIVWGLLVNITTGLDSIPLVQREVGQNMELTKLRFLIDIEIPACMPYIIAGIKQAFARAWRTIIAIEAVAGVALGNTGLGWLITQQRSMLDIPGLFSTMIVIIVIGVLFEDIIFKYVEKNTILKWGISR